MGAWPRYDPASDQHVELDVAPSAGAGLRRAQCDLWDRVDGASP